MPKPIAGIPYVLRLAAKVAWYSDRVVSISIGPFKNIQLIIITYSTLTYETGISIRE